MAAPLLQMVSVIFVEFSLIILKLFLKNIAILIIANNMDTHNKRKKLYRKVSSYFFKGCGRILENCTKRYDLIRIMPKTEAKLIISLSEIYPMFSVPKIIRHADEFG
jgi:hypothetical protein